MYIHTYDAVLYINTCTSLYPQTTIATNLMHSFWRWGLSISFALNLFRNSFKFNKSPYCVIYQVLYCIVSIIVLHTVRSGWLLSTAVVIVTLSLIMLYFLSASYWMRWILTVHYSVCCRSITSGSVNRLVSMYKTYLQYTQYTQLRQV